MSPDGSGMDDNATNMTTAMAVTTGNGSPCYLKWYILILSI